MSKALVIGINDYPTAKLRCCVRDAEAVAALLTKHENNTPNFSVKLYQDVKTREALKGYISELFSGDPEVALLYFSGHGYSTATGTFLVTPDASKNSPGISLDEILVEANASRAKDRIIILDCCHAGAFGDPVITGGKAAYLHAGTTIMTASRSDEKAIEANGHGIFTNLLLEALKGGAADILGQVSPAGIYAYIDKSLGDWHQRPVFKTNSSHFITLRKSSPTIPLEALHKMTKYFSEPLAEYGLDPSYEPTNTKNVEHQIVEPEADPEKVAIMSNLQKMQRVGLVVPVDEEHLYFAAMNSKTCKLTPLGHHYWRLIKEERI